MPAALDASDPPFDLRLSVPGQDGLQVVRLRGRERISRVYSFRVTFVTTSHGLEDPASVRAALDAEATLQFVDEHGEPRVIRGLVTSLRAQGVDARGRRVLVARIQPRLALLAMGQRSRIFQEQTLSAIVGAILRERGVAHRLALTSTERVRAYCVQHRESDLAFLERLFAEDGVFFWFEPPAAVDGPEVLVIADSAGGYPRIAGPPALLLKRSEGASAMVHDASAVVTRFARRNATALRGAHRKGYDPLRPLVDLSATAGDAASPRVFYEHHDDDERVVVDAARAALLLEQGTAESDVAEGTSSSRRLSPGHSFDLTDPESPAWSGAYLLTAVEHEGHDPALSGETGPVYEARFRCVPASVAARPRRGRRAPKPGLETAVVVGSPGEEIHTDALGRVKVRFHWDLGGAPDDHASCWIRVTQAWAGGGWGFQFVPRVGMEVLVGFLGDDPDRPVVLGGLPNATHPPPHALPQAKTRSGIRTRSTPHSAGYNEIAFDDAAGAEQITVRAERDVVSTIGHDHVESVGGDHKTTVLGDHALQVAGDRRERVAGALEQTVLGGASVSVSGDARSAMKGSVAEDIERNRSVTVGGSDTTTIRGESITIVDGPHVLRVDARHTVIVGAEREDGEAEISVSKKYTVASGGTIRIRAEEQIELACGDSLVRIGPRGVVVKAPQIELRGTESVIASSHGPTLRLVDEAMLASKVVKIYSEDATIELDREASIQSKAIKLGSGVKKSDLPSSSDDAPETQPFAIKLTDEEYKPYTNKSYKMACEGARFEGTIPASGLIKHDVPKGATSAQITLWLHEYPEGPIKQYSIQIEPLPAPASPAGVQVRLKNLGYYHGPGKGVLDDETRAALRSFQTDHGMEPTGDLDAPTQAKIVERHGS